RHVTACPIDLLNSTPEPRSSGPRRPAGRRRPSRRRTAPRATVPPHARSVHNSRRRTVRSGHSGPMRNSAEYLPPAMAMARSREPAELLRVAEAWRGIDPGGPGLSRAAGEAAGALLDSGQVPLLGAGTGAGLRFDFPDGTRVLLDQRFFVRSGDRCTCGGQRCLHRSAALRSLMENRFRRSWRMMPDLLGPDP